MLSIGRQRQQTCQTRDRRAFLQAGFSTVLGLSMADWLRARSAGPDIAAAPAKSVVLIWLWGGPAHLDTWDPKPNAPLEYRGPFQPIATRVPGIRIGELFPRLADIADQFSILRGLHTTSNDHGVAGTIGLTGNEAGSINLGGNTAAGRPRPALGSVVARSRGAAASLPPFLVVGGKLHQGKKAIAGEGGGTLGGFYDPFRLEYAAGEGFHIPALELATDLTPDRLRDRRRLMEALDQVERKAVQASATGGLDSYREQAFGLLTDPQSRQVFDLSREKESTHDLYGRTRFGQSCLLARRLVERAVPFIQVNWSDHVEAEEDSGDGGWDHHYRNFQIMQDRHAPWLDQTLSAFLGDLKDRGLLTQTLVLAVGEFGRTPKINDKAGRDHWEHCYGALIAGGGIPGGRVIGSSDARGEHPVDGRCTPADLAATVHRQVGISSEMAQTLGVGTGGTVIDGLL
jgi:Protein of unknown function (DUF1501)